MGDIYVDSSMSMLLVTGMTILISVILHFIYKTVFGSKKNEALNHITESNLGKFYDIKQYIALRFISLEYIKSGTLKGIVCKGTRGLSRAFPAECGHIPFRRYRVYFLALYVRRDVYFNCYRLAENVDDIHCSLYTVFDSTQDNARLDLIVNKAYNVTKLINRIKP